MPGSWPGRRERGTTLFMSPGTADYHLHRVLWLPRERMTVSVPQDAPLGDLGVAPGDRLGITLFGYSLGGYLVARAAAFDHRVAAMILDDGIYDFHTAFTRALPPFLASWIADGRDEEAVPVLSLLTTVSTSVRWAMNNGVWAFGAASRIRSPRQP